MEDFEQDLRGALRRREPPAGFEARVLAAAGSPPKARVPYPLRWVMPLAAALVLTAGIAWQRERAAEEQAAGEHAKARLELALRITSAKLHKIHQTLEASE